MLTLVVFEKQGSMEVHEFVEIIVREILDSQKTLKLKVNSNEYKFGNVSKHGTGTIDTTAPSKWRSHTK